VFQKHNKYVRARKDQEERENAESFFTLVNERVQELAEQERENNTFKIKYDHDQIVSFLGYKK
jgi:hypothetical protein